METLYTLLALCEGNPTVGGEFFVKGPEMMSFDIFVVRLDKLLNNYSSCRGFGAVWLLYSILILALMKWVNYAWFSFCAWTIRVNTSRLRQIGWRFVGNIVERIFLFENVSILIKILLRFVPG